MLTVTWGNGVLYDADAEWTERKEMVQMGLLKPELALAWKYDLPAETEADLASSGRNICRSWRIWKGKVQPCVTDSLLT